MTLTIDFIVVGFFSENTYFLTDPQSQETIIVDPGGSGKEIKKYIEKNNLKPTMIVNTHGHPDHTEANEFIKNLYNIPVLIHREDGKMFGIPYDREIKEGDILTFSNNKYPLKVLHTPGHTPGGVCLWGDGFLLTGDTLFAGSMGRTDIGGDEKIMKQTLKEKFDVIPGETVLYPGHGQETVMEKERKTNPYIRWAKTG